MKASRIIAFSLALMFAAISVIISVGAIQDMVSSADNQPPSDENQHPMAPLAQIIYTVLYGIIFIACIVFCLTGVICSLVNIVQRCSIRWVHVTSICTLTINSIAFILIIVDLIIR